MSEVEIIVKSYPKEAETLIKIWKSHLNSANKELEYIIFKNKRPSHPKSSNRRIAGLPAEAISYLKDDVEIVKMSVEDFIYLMVKCGVDIEVEKVK